MLAGMNPLVRGCALFLVGMVCAGAQVPAPRVFLVDAHTLAGAKAHPDAALLKLATDEADAALLMSQSPGGLSTVDPKQRTQMKKAGDIQLERADDLLHLARRAPWS